MTVAVLDQTKLAYALMLFSPSDGTLVPLTPTMIQWEEQTGQLAVRLTATVANVQIGGAWLHQVIALAAQMVLTADWGDGEVEVFRGQVWQWKFSDAGVELVEFTAYDSLFNLNRSKDSRMYNPQASPYGAVTLAPGGTLTAGAILQDISDSWGLNIQGCGLLGTPMAQMVWQITPLSQMVMELIDRTYWYGGGSFYLRSDHGTISVMVPASNLPIYLLTGDGVESYSDEQDMQDLVTRVLVIGTANAGSPTSGISLNPDGNLNKFLLNVEASYDGHTEYGIMQDIITDPGVVLPAGIAQFAKQTIGNRGQPRRIQRFDAPDLPFLRRGDAIAVQIGTLNGIYIVSGIQHDADRRRMQITVDTSGDLTAPDVQYAVTPGTAALPSEAVGRTHSNHVFPSQNKVS